MSISLGRRPSLRKRRRFFIISSCFSLFIVFVLYGSHDWSAGVVSTTAAHFSSVPDSHLLEEQARFWRSLFHIVLNNDPKCEKTPEVVVPTKLDIAYEDNHLHDRPDILWVDNADLQRLKTAHQNFVNDVQLSKLKLVYEKGTRGIITTVSDTQIPVLLIQLRMLRMTGSSLPVEVFLSQPTPYTDHICMNILPEYNAVCVYYSQIFATAGQGVGLSSYQFKIFAILFSSFEDVLLLDSDAWPINSPDHLFMYPPFSESGLILWPDFWYASESPYFFAIAKIENPPLLHHKSSIESGELMYSKSKHEASIMLATYYNYYGPDYYYPLQSQGAPGQGDKETFASAALALKENFYWVKTAVGAIGRIDSSGHFLGSAMVQYDPIVDLQHRHDTSIHPNINPPPTPSPPDGTDHPHPEHSKKAMFIHANVPKFDPRLIFDDHDMGNGINTSPTRDTNGTNVRCWDLSPEQIQDRFGYDVERRFWHAIRAVACDDLVGPGDTSRKSKELDVCRRVEAYVRDVFDEDA